MEWLKGDEVVERELYDRLEDPEERVNLIEGEERSEVAETLSLQLKRGEGWKDVRPK